MSRQPLHATVKGPESSLVQSIKPPVACGGAASVLAAVEEHLATGSKRTQANARLLTPAVIYYKKSSAGSPATKAPRKTARFLYATTTLYSATKQGARQCAQPPQRTDHIQSVVFTAETRTRDPHHVSVSFLFQQSLRQSNSDKSTIPHAGDRMRGATAH
ncbi:hypothetical protein SKAU_G00146570 [Synaphobranchus kaupii]|uniref:Uncharacterized protein n=1 Tax=Synaphobranchus kaupii TaxID=118154 RepID=A0A9Q1J4H8_SYNKA|nr:hypothetical protein SKAU_G00146570 [Synaphobranchus kaupii]